MIFPSDYTIFVFVCTAFTHTDFLSFQIHKQSTTDMLSGIAYRSLAHAKAAHADVKVLAAGDSDAQLKAIQMLKDMAPSSGVGYVSTLPKGEDDTLRAALLSKTDDQYEHVREYSDDQLAIAATLIAADLVYMGRFDEPAVFTNMDAFVPAVNDRARGFCNEQLFSLVPWFANIGAANGVFFDASKQLVLHEGWCLFPDADEEQCTVALYDASRFDSGLQMISYRANAFDVQLVDTRRIMCSGFIMRSFFGFFSQLPGFVGPKIPNKIVLDGKMSDSSPDVLMEKETAESSKAPAKRIRKESDF